MQFSADVQGTIVGGAMGSDKDNNMPSGAGSYFAGVLLSSAPAPINIYRHKSGAGVQAASNVIGPYSIHQSIDHITRQK